MIGKILRLFRLLIFLLTMLKHRLNGQSLRNAHDIDPMIVISYDDGNITDYCKAYPVHKEAGVGAELCVITGRIGSSGYLTKNQLKDFESAGWEIVSHSRNHNPLCDSFLKKPALKGDKRISVDHAYRFQKNSDCILGRGYKKERVKVIGISDDFLYIERELALKHRKYERFRVSDEQLLEEVLGSRNDLMEIGIKVKNFTYPYNAFSEWSVRIIENYYESARGERLIPIGRGRLNKNIKDSFNRYFLYSFLLEDGKISEKDIISILNRMRKKGGVCIFYAHTSSEGFNPDLLRFVFREAEERGIKLVTRSMVC